MIKRVYVTTPIYYANGAPHIGTAYTSLIADVFARSKRLLGYQVKFCTWTDENGQKMKKTASEQGKEVMIYLDEIASLHQSTRDSLQISYTDFIRTTHPTHHAFTKKILEDALLKWHVYQWEYEGLYCLGCESFKKDWDLVEHEWKRVCPEHLKVPDTIKEKNRFFKLSEFQSELEEFYKNNLGFSLPKHRYNEITSFAKQGLEDFSISREWSDFWIPLPEGFNDPDSVVYIRFDALYNYLTTCLYSKDFTKNWQSVSWEKDDMIFWESEVVHIIWKDISRFHGIYRPAMLMSSKYKLPDKEIINGFFTVDGQKMSKSLWNKIDPLELLEEHGRDALVYYLFSDIKIWNDGDFSRERFEVAQENVLKKWWWNLVSRVGKLCSKYEIVAIDIKNLESRIEVLWKMWWLQDNKLRWLFTIFDRSIIDRSIIDISISEADYMTYLRDRFQIVQTGNQFLQQSEPWIHIKNPETEQKARQDLQLSVRMIKQLWLLSSPFLVDWFKRLQDIIQIKDDNWKTFQTWDNEEWLGDKFEKLLAMKEFEVEIGEGYVY